MLVVSISISGCKKDDDDDVEDDPTKKDYAVVIENGAQSINPDESMNYSAYLVDADGTKIEATKDGELTITWSVSEGSIATISAAGAISVVTSGSVTITATATYNGETYTASVPLGIYTPPTLFAVAPSAIIGVTNDVYELMTVFLGIENEPSYSYSSTDESVATVSDAGTVTLVGVGLCNILVTASTMQDAPFYIPVCVVAIPEIVLPIVRVEVAPASAEKFRGETAQFSATAYDLENAAVITTFEWSSLDTDIATVDAAGLVTTRNVGNTYIQAVSKGIIGQAEIVVLPDTVIVLTPFWASFAAGATTIMVAVPGMGCDCGDGNPYVASITTSSSSYTITMGGMADIGAIALDAFGSEVMNPELVYCSDNEVVCSVIDGTIYASMSGTATVTICSGSIETTVTVTVQ